MERRSRKAIYVISVAAELTGVHPQTLRIYEKGLVTPARTRGGSRRYSDADVALLSRIAELTSEGMNEFWGSKGVSPNSKPNWRHCIHRLPAR